MLWGVTLFGCILGELASLLTNADAQRTCYIHRLNVIKEELTDAQVSPGLMKRTIGFYEYLVSNSHFLGKQNAFLYYYCTVEEK